MSFLKLNERINKPFKNRVDISEKTYLSALKHELYACMGEIIKETGSMPILINGIDNHVHILCVMSKNISLSKLVEKKGTAVGG